MAALHESCRGYCEQMQLELPSPKPGALASAGGGAGREEEAAGGGGGGKDGGACVLAKVCKAQLRACIAISLIACTPSHHRLFTSDAPSATPRRLEVKGDDSSTPSQSISFQSSLLQTSTSSSHLFRHTPGGGDVRRFLNRLLGLRVEEQALMFAYYAAVLGAEIQKVGGWGARVCVCVTTRPPAPSPHSTHGAAINPAAPHPPPCSVIKTPPRPVNHGTTCQHLCGVMNH